MTRTLRPQNLFLVFVFGGLLAFGSGSADQWFPIFDAFVQGRGLSAPIVDPGAIARDLCRGTYEVVRAASGLASVAVPATTAVCNSAGRAAAEALYTSQGHVYPQSAIGAYHDRSSPEGAAENDDSGSNVSYTQDQQPVSPVPQLIDDVKYEVAGGVGELVGGPAGGLLFRAGAAVVDQLGYSAQFWGQPRVNPEQAVADGVKDYVLHLLGLP